MVSIGTVALASVIGAVMALFAPASVVLLEVNSEKRKRGKDKC